MMGLFALPLILSLPNSTQALPSFAEAWHREVFEGNIASAAKDYETIYLSPSSTRLTAEMQRKAAFRAGICFEKLGLAPSARLAFATVLRLEGSHGVLERDALSAEASVRLKGLSDEIASAEASLTSPGQPPAGAQPSPQPLDPSDVSADVAFQTIADTLRAAEKARGGVIAAWESEVILRREKALVAAGTMVRLSRLGVVLSFAADAPSFRFPVEDLTQATRRALSSDVEAERVYTFLCHRFQDRLLAALESSSRAPAVRALHYLEAFSPPSPGLHAWARSVLDRGLDGSSGAAVSAMARRRILDEDLREKAAVTTRIHRILDEARDWEERGRKDRAIDLLDQVRGDLDWIRPSVRDDVEVRMLAAEASRGLHILGKGRLDEDLFGRLWIAAREQVGRLLALAEDLTEMESQMIRLQGPVQAGGRADATEVCRREAEILASAAADAAARRGDPGLARRHLSEAKLILDWVPAADPQSKCREALAAVEEMLQPR
ncbi:MAG TPA: hypothetical protein VMT52_09300 [Planctomycetota bacterium]|nr:hypothetical protein [Planctomycetota bacterium]